MENEKDTLNTPAALSLEATYINQNFAFQVVRDAPEARIDLEHPNPFYQADVEAEPLASCAFRYRKFDLSVTEEEDVGLVVRTEVDAYTKQANEDKPTYITIRTLNEFDSRAQGAGGAPDWRTKLDSQRGAVVATEMKNNSSKLARWAVQSVLAGAEQMKMGYVAVSFFSEFSRGRSTLHDTLRTERADNLLSTAPLSVTSRVRTRATPRGIRSSARSGTSRATLPAR